MNSKMECIFYKIANNKAFFDMLKSLNLTSVGSESFCSKVIYIFISLSLAPYALRKATKTFWDMAVSTLAKDRKIISVCS